MKKTFCDKCHGEIYGKTSTLQIYSEIRTTQGVNFDLCKSCFRKLEEFLKNE